MGEATGVHGHKDWILLPGKSRAKLPLMSMAAIRALGILVGVGTPGSVVKNTAVQTQLEWLGAAQMRMSLCGPREVDTGLGARIPALCSQFCY